MSTSKSSLSSVVSDLVRAQMGTAVLSTVTDEDLDRHVAELILREAKQKAERYGKDGIKAYLPSGFSESNAPKTNKRFLSTIIRSTDDHNKTILRAQAIAAQEVRREKEEQDRRDRRARAEEAVAAERQRRLTRSSGRTDWAHNWDRGDRRNRKRRERSWERDEDERSVEKERRSDGRERDHRHRHRSRSGERSSRREDHRHSRSTRSHHRHDDDQADKRRHRRDREENRSMSPERSREPSLDRENTTKRPRRRDPESRNDHQSYQSPRARSRSLSPKDRGHSSRSHRHKSRRSPTQSDREDSASVAASHHSSYRDEIEAKEAVLSREDELRLKLKRKGKAKASDDLETLANHPQPHSRASPVTMDKERSGKPSSHPGVSKPESVSSHTFRSSASPSRSPPPPASSPPPLPPPSVPSKMDRYFESSYDPRLDVAPLAVPQVPATGLISDAEFEGWDAMLEIIRLRREDKAEKKILERWGVGKDKSKDKKRKKDDDGPASRWSEGGLNIMDIEYKKRGSVREWDLGKEGF